MKRLRALAVLAAVAFGLAGCAPGDAPVLTVNGAEVLTTDEFQAQLDQLADDEDFLTLTDGRGAGAGTLSSGFVASVLSNEVLDALLVEELEAEGVETTEDDVTTGSEQLAGAVGGPIEDIPSRYRETLVDLFAHAGALRGTLDDDEAALQARITELLADAEVEVAARYGRWDTEQGQVVPPEGPVTPTTTIPPAPVPAG